MMYCTPGPSIEIRTIADAYNCTKTQEPQANQQLEGPIEFLRRLTTILIAAAHIRREKLGP